MPKAEVVIGGGMVARGIARTLPFVKSLQGTAGSMEIASNALWDSLRHVSVADLKALRPTIHYVPLIDALIAVRELMEERA